MAATRRIQIPGDSQPFPFEEGLVVARPPATGLFLLNPTARVIWESLRDGASLEEAAAELSAATGIGGETARADVEASVVHWERQGLLGAVAASPRAEGAAAGLTESRRERRGQAVAETRHYRLIGRTFAVTYEDDGLRRAIHPRFANLEEPAGGAAETALEIFRTDGEGVGYTLAGATVAAPSAQAAAHRLFFDLTAAAHDGSRIAAWLHGGVLSRGGASVVLVGARGSGKSTLNAALLHAGWECFGDDRVLLEADTLRPMASPNAIGLKPGSWPVLRGQWPEIETWPVHRIGENDVRYLPTPAPTTRLAPPVRAILFPRFEAGATTRLVPLSSTDVLQRIVEAYAWVAPTAPDIEAWLCWVRSGAGYALPFGSLDEAVKLVGELVPT